MLMVSVTCTAMLSAPSSFSPISHFTKPLYTLLQALPDPSLHDRTALEKFACVCDSAQQADAVSVAQWQSTLIQRAEFHATQRKYYSLEHSHRGVVSCCLEICVPCKGGYVIALDVEELTESKGCRGGRERGRDEEGGMKRGKEGQGKLTQTGIASGRRC